MTAAATVRFLDEIKASSHHWLCLQQRVAPPTGCIRPLHQQGAAYSDSTAGNASCGRFICACAAWILPFRHPSERDKMGHQQLYWSHPRKFGQGSRSWSVLSVNLLSMHLWTWRIRVECVCWLRYVVFYPRTPTAWEPIHSQYGGGGCVSVELA